MERSLSGVKSRSVEAPPLIAPSSAMVSSIWDFVLCSDVFCRTGVDMTNELLLCKIVKSGSLTVTSSSTSV